MKPDTNTGFTRTATMVPEQTIAMGIRTEDFGWIMRHLTDLYSDPAGAVVREYATNAFDSHVDAGQTRPIEISLPGALSPNYVVKDYGLGMDVDDIREVYSQYGHSTKRQSDAVVGMLGLGSKSALTYTNQFTVVGVKHGVKTTVLVYRDALGAGQMDIIDTRATDEPNGVEIRVPAKNPLEMERKANAFFRFWQPGTVLVNGKEPGLGTHTVIIDKPVALPCKPTEVPHIVERVLIVDGLDEDYVVMGNVAYPVKNHGLYGGSRYYGNTFGVVAYVSIGAVHFTPAREALQYDDHTNKTLWAAREAVKNGLVEAAQRDVNEAKTHGEAVKKRARWIKCFGNQFTTLKYKGTDIPTSFTMPVLQWEVNRNRGAVNNERQVYMASLTDDKAAIVTGFTLDSLPSRLKEKTRKYMSDHGLHFTKLFFVEKEFGAPWTDNLTVIKFDDIKAVKLSSGSGPRVYVKREQPYDVLTSDGNVRQTDTIDTSVPVFYFSPAEKFDNYDLRRFIKDATLVSIGMNRWDKFQRDFPTARHIREAVKERYAAVTAAVTQADVDWNNRDYADSNFIQGMDANKVDDPEVAEFIRTKNNPEAVERLNAHRAWSNFARTCGIAMLSVPQPRVKPKRFAYRYPLAANNYGNQSSINHVYIYMNAVYAATKGN